MKVLEELFVAWQNPKNHSYFPVGHLQHLDDAGEEYYEFTYIKGASEAAEQGFEPFLTFPQLGETYRSKDLFSFFTNRVLLPSRSDYEEFVSSLGLTAENPSPIQILARSGGRRATDSIEVFAPPLRDSVAGRNRLASYFFLAHGVRHMKDCAQRFAETLKHGDRLFIMHDLQNPADRDALTLRTEDYCCVGFLPRYLLADSWELLRTDGAIEVTVERLNPPPAPVQQRILCKLQAVPEEDFQPCSSDVYKPYVTHTSSRQ